jgi:hypothetical protein
MLRQDNLEFTASLGYTARPCLKKKEEGKQRGGREREGKRRKEKKTYLHSWCSLAVTGGSSMELEFCQSFSPQVLAFIF